MIYICILLSSYKLNRKKSKQNKKRFKISLASSIYFMVDVGVVQPLCGVSIDPVPRIASRVIKSFLRCNSPGFELFHSSLFTRPNIFPSYHHAYSYSLRAFETS